MGGLGTAIMGQEDVGGVWEGLMMKWKMNKTKDETKMKNMMVWMKEIGKVMKVGIDRRGVSLPTRGG